MKEKKTPNKSAKKGMGDEFDTPTKASDKKDKKDRL